MADASTKYFPAWPHWLRLDGANWYMCTIDLLISYLPIVCPVFFFASTEVATTKKTGGTLLFAQTWQINPIIIFLLWDSSPEHHIHLLLLHYPPLLLYITTVQKSPGHFQTSPTGWELQRCSTPEVLFFQVCRHHFLSPRIWHRGQILMSLRATVSAQWNRLHV